MDLLGHQLHRDRMIGVDIFFLERDGEIDEEDMKHVIENANIEIFHARWRRKS